MTSAEQSVREGNLSQALDELQQRVRRNAASGPERAFLFQLLALQGQWERAANQLKVLGDLDASALITVQMYQPAIQCELLRAKVFSGETTPLLLGEPEQWMALLLESLKHLAGGRYEAAGKLREQALEAAPARAGSINGEPFEWIADSDPRLGPCLELIVDGKYYWTPITNLQSLRLEPPTDLRDLIWAQATVTWANGGQVPALLPVRYPGSESSTATDSHRLSRKTDWIQQPDETVLGVGQRMLATDTGEYALLEVRELLITAPTTPA
jgi:type VI secretion system protein ImpE